MTDEHKLIRDKGRGQRAKSLLENEMMVEAFKALEADYIKAWAGTDPSQAAARENYYRAVQILGDVRRHLLKVATNGTLAERELDNLANQFRPRAA